MARQVLLHTGHGFVDSPGHLFTNEQAQRWGDMRRSTNLLGRQMLLARRLCEAGCGFVTVSDCGWDMHSNGNSPKNLGGMSWLGPQVSMVLPHRQHRWSGSAMARARMMRPATTNARSRCLALARFMASTRFRGCRTAQS